MEPSALDYPVTRFQKRPQDPYGARTAFSRARVHNHPSQRAQIVTEAFCKPERICCFEAIGKPGQNTKLPEPYFGSIGSGSADFGGLGFAKMPNRMSNV